MLIFCNWNGGVQVPQPMWPIKRVHFPLSTCRLLVLNLDYGAWQQASVPMAPSCQPQSLTTLIQFHWVRQEYVYSLWTHEQEAKAAPLMVISRLLWDSLTAVSQHALQGQMITLKDIPPVHRHSAKATSPLRTSSGGRHHLCWDFILVTFWWCNILRLDKW